MGSFLKFMLALIIAQISFGAIADGIPRPWPFPWAVECPMAWEELDGRYNMIGSTRGDQIVVRITTNIEKDLRTVRIIRYGFSGETQAIGLSMVDSDEREVRVHMIPLKPEGDSTWVTLRMYYSSDIKSCTRESLVPILTVTPEKGTGTSPDEEYLLSKLK